MSKRLCVARYALALPPSLPPSLPGADSRDPPRQCPKGLALPGTPLPSLPPSLSSSTHTPTHTHTRMMLPPSLLPSFPPSFPLERRAQICSCPLRNHGPVCVCDGGDGQGEGGREGGREGREKTQVPFVLIANYSGNSVLAYSMSQPTAPPSLPPSLPPLPPSRCSSSIAGHRKRRSSL